MRGAATLTCSISSVVAQSVSPAGRTTFIVPSVAASVVDVHRSSSSKASMLSPETKKSGCHGGGAWPLRLRLRLDFSPVSQHASRSFGESLPTQVVATRIIAFTCQRQRGSAGSAGRARLCTVRRLCEMARWCCRGVAAPGGAWRGCWALPCSTSKPSRGAAPR